MYERIARRVRAASILLVGALTAAVITGSATTRTTYIITDGTVVTTVAGYAGEVDSALRRANIQINDTDLVTSVRDGDIVSVTVQRPVTALEEHVVESLPYTILRRENPDLPLGEERVVQTGAEGNIVRTVEVVTEPDGAVHRTDLGTRTAAEPVTEIVEYGTRLPAVSASYLSVTADVLTNRDQRENGSGILTTSSGETLSYSSVMNCVATAYTTERQSWKMTATGTTARVGAIAVDPKVIPYGTRMYIVSADGSITYGVATAEDCGGGIKGARIDLFFDTYKECINFGVRDCAVYILN